VERKDKRCLPDRDILIGDIAAMSRRNDTTRKERSGVGPLSSSGSAASDETVYRLMLQIVSRLENRSVHLLHGISKFDTESTKDVALPCVVLRIHARLDLFVVNNADHKGLLRLGGVKGSSGLLNLR